MLRSISVNRSKRRTVLPSGTHLAVPVTFEWSLLFKSTDNTMNIVMSSVFNYTFMVHYFSIFLLTGYYIATCWNIMVIKALH